METPLITEATPAALAMCAGWLEGHARLLLADADARRAIFNLCFDFVCASAVDLGKVLIIEACVREACAREGLPAPTVAQFFNSLPWRKEWNRTTQVIPPQPSSRR